jgi:outer membrane protein TolC
MLSQMIGEKISDDEKFETPSDFSAAAASNINRPELRLYENQRQLVNAQMKMVTVNYMPKVGVLGAGLLIEPGMSLGGATFNSFALAGLSISWNTTGLYTGKNTKQLAQINLDKINNQQETFLFNTNMQLTHAKNDIMKQRTLLQEDDEIISLKESIRKSYETRFQNGMSSMNDLLAVENGESDARSSRAEHEIQLLMSLYNLKTISGN